MGGVELGKVVEHGLREAVDQVFRHRGARDEHGHDGRQDDLSVLVLVRVGRDLFDRVEGVLLR